MKNKLAIKIANIVSDVFNPVALAIIILVAAVYKSKMPDHLEMYWYIAIFVLDVLIPGLVYLFFTKKGFVFDGALANEKIKKERIILLGIFLLVTVVEILVVQISGYVYQPLYAVLIGGAISLVIASIISYFWKISMHSSGVTMLVMMFLLVFGMSMWPLIILIPLVWWARLVLKRHNIWQLLAGCALSIGIIYLVFMHYMLV